LLKQKLALKMKSKKKLVFIPEEPTNVNLALPLAKLTKIDLPTKHPIGNIQLSLKLSMKKNYRLVDLFARYKALHARSQPDILDLSEIPIILFEIKLTLLLAAHSFEYIQRNLAVKDRLEAIGPFLFTRKTFKDMFSHIK
jgi:hypothetical protein